MDKLPNSGLGPIQLEGWGFKRSHPGMLGSREDRSETGVPARQCYDTSGPSLQLGKARLREGARRLRGAYVLSDEAGFQSQAWFCSEHPLLLERDEE